MLLECPNCQTAFQVADAAIGNGRTVRCAKCRESWFAEPKPVFAEALADGEPDAFAAMPAPPEAGWDTDPFATSATVDDAPPLAAEDFSEIALSPEERILPAAEIPAKPRARSSSRLKVPAIAPLAMLKNIKLPRPVAIAFVAALIGCVSIFAARESVVRLMPDFAGLYAAVGLPVNLRGLEFKNVKTVQEMQDGIPVLVIEGEIVNIARHPVEVPRVRIAVLGSSQQELYSWTTLMPRSILADGEKLSFRSRLASPPPNGEEVMVRFLTRNDLTGGT